MDTSSLSSCTRNKSLSSGKFSSSIPSSSDDEDEDYEDVNRITK
jgi:hypothetical protein